MLIQLKEAQTDGFEASDIFPGLAHPTFIFPLSATKKCSERIIHEHQGTRCKSDENTDRGI
jgi:hypothetical protein